MQIYFNDIAEHWAERFIFTAARQNLVHGYPDGTFKPNNPISRAEFMVVLSHALQLERKDSTISYMEFTDQDKIASWARESVELAVQSGIVSGYPDGTFRPNAYITREELAMIIAKVLGVEINVNSKPFLMMMKKYRIGPRVQWRPSASLESCAVVETIASSRKKRLRGLKPSL